MYKPVKERTDKELLQTKQQHRNVTYWKYNELIDEVIRLRGELNEVAAVRDRQYPPVEISRHGIELYGQGARQDRAKLRGQDLVPGVDEIRMDES